MTGSELTIDREAERRAERLENPDALERDDDYVELFAPKNRDGKPWRDPDSMADVWEEYESVVGVAETLDMAKTTASTWLYAWGLRDRRDQAADILRYSLSPEDVGLDPIRDEGGAD